MLYFDTGNVVCNSPFCILLLIMFRNIRLCNTRQSLVQTLLDIPILPPPLDPIDPQRTAASRLEHFVWNQI